MDHAERRVRLPGEPCWFGPMRYNTWHRAATSWWVTAPNGDVPLYTPRAMPIPPPRRPQPELVLRFAGTRWVAIDNSRTASSSTAPGCRRWTSGTGRRSRVGDSQRGPRPGVPDRRPRRSARATNRRACPDIAPPRRLPDPCRRRADEHEPTLRTPGKFRYPRHARRRPQGPSQAPPPIACGPATYLHRLTEPAAAPPPPAARRGSAAHRPRADRCGMTDATRKLRAQPAPLPTEGNPFLTHRFAAQGRAARTVGLAAYQLGLTVDEHELLTDVSFTARPGTLTAVTGPSAARNSVLLGLLAGTRGLDSGRITVTATTSMPNPKPCARASGIVPRDDRLHPQLTVQRTLGYAAETAAAGRCLARGPSARGGPGSRRARADAVSFDPNQQASARVRRCAAIGDGAHHQADPAAD